MGTLAEIQVDEVLVGHAGFLGHRLEVLDHIGSKANRDPLAEVLGAGVADRIGEVVFFSRNTSPVCNGWYGQGRELASGEVGSKG
jgi:hypothetical protein